MLNITLLKNILIISMASSIISTSLIQRLKEAFKKRKYIIIKSFLVSMTIGVLFSYSFTDISLANSFWVGLISFIGADAIYKAFEDKIFASFSSLENVIYIERNDKK